MDAHVLAQLLDKHLGPDNTPIRQKLIDYCTSPTKEAEATHPTIIALLSLPEDASKSHKKNATKEFTSMMKVLEKIIPDTFSTREDIHEKLAEDGYVTPSSVTKGQAWFLDTTHPLAVDRAVEPPIPMLLFSKVFADFCNNLDNIEFGNDEVILVSKLRQKMIMIFDSETDRVAAFNRICNDYFGFKFASHTFQNPLDPKSHPYTDASYFLPNISALIVNIEAKPELGIGTSELYLQNAQYYLLACINSLDLFVKTDYPCFLINLIGTHISVCGALIMEKPTVSWLTPVVPLYSSNNQDTSYLCRLFKSLKKGFADLIAYYSSIPSSSRKMTKPLPFINEMDTPNGKVLWDYRYAITLKSTKIMFKAYLRNNKEPVIVKFVQSYSHSAHSCMATARFAPVIYGIVKITKSWHLVIMEDLPASEWKSIKKGSKPTAEHKTNLQRAISHLHNNGFVHGDLRPNNILFNETDKSVMILDWDWAGHLDNDKPRYPVDINMKGIKWPPGVAPNALITKEHDLAWVAEFAL